MLQEMDMKVGIVEWLAVAVDGGRGPWVSAVREEWKGEGVCSEWIFGSQFMDFLIHYKCDQFELL